MFGFIQKKKKKKTTGLTIGQNLTTKLDVVLSYNFTQ